MNNNEVIENQRSITVQLLNIDGKVEMYKNVTFVKIVSKTYNLIIMKDYLPIIGEVIGKVEIGTDEDIIKLENVKGYFMNKHNNFNLFYSI